MSNIQVAGQPKGIKEVWVQVGGAPKKCKEMYVQVSGAIKSVPCGDTDTASCCDGAPISSGFLKHYVNPIMTSLPANKIYPIGQRMLLSAWNPSTIAQVDKMHEHGCTCVGPWENAWPSSNKAIPTLISHAASLGMRCHLFMHNGHPLVHKVCEAFASGKTDAEIIQGMVNLWTNYYSKSPYNENCDLFCLLPEELAGRLGTCSSSRLLQFNEATIAKIKQLAGTERPIVRTELESGVQSSTINSTAKNVAMPHRQFYYEGAEYGAGGYRHQAILQSRLNGDIGFFNSLESNHPIAQTRYRGVLPSTIYATNTTDPAFPKTYANWYIFLCLAKGVKAFGLYKWNAQVAAGLMDAYLNTIKVITDNSIDYAFLWGDSKPASRLTVTQTSGETSAGWSQGSSTYVADSLVWAERQFKNCRHLVITNSHWSSTIGVRISGLPVGDFWIKDCLTGTSEQIKSTTKNISLGPYKVGVYRIETCTGSGGGGGTTPTPTTKPVITVPPLDATVKVGESATFTISATGATSYQWQYAMASAPTTWLNPSQPSAKTRQYITAALSDASDGTLIRCQVSNAAGTTGSRTVKITMQGVGVDFSEKVTNGDFAANVNGWTSGLGAIISWDAGQMKIANGQADRGQARQLISGLTPGQKYIVRFTRNASSGWSTNFMLGSTDWKTTDLYTKFTSVTGIYSGTFTAPASGKAYLTIAVGSAGKGDWIKIDVISIKATV